jgi:hypothetical protein
MTARNADAVSLSTAARRRAIAFIILLGCVSLFADMTYEGGRSIAGPFLGALGASAVVVSIAAGLGEFIGYGLRYVSGRAADRGGRYWAIMTAGYLINLLSVPLLALAGSWPVAMLLLVAERAGRAIRAPIRGAMLSHAASQTGAGWGFGLHTALDQTGGMAGPLLIAALIGNGASYRRSFAVLLIPALASLAVLFTARLLYPDPRKLEPLTIRPEHVAWSGFDRTFRFYTLASAFIAAGFADFALIAFHLARAGVTPPSWVPLLYALAMASEGAFALVIGRLLDRFGAPIVLMGIGLAALATPLLFVGDAAAAVIGAALWGIGMAVQDTALRGTAWLAGSAVLGLLYTISLPALVGASLVLQLAAIPVLVGSGLAGSR